MSLYRVGLKLFARSTPAVPLTDFIPVFHRWIRESAFDGPLLDVADYSHVHEGPGVLVAGFDANVCIDLGQGRFGLMWYHKRPTSEPIAVLLQRGARRLIEMCVRLENEPELAGRLGFSGEEMVVFSNDRLLAPNTEAGWGLLGPEVERLGAVLFGDDQYSVERERVAQERLSATLRSKGSPTMDALLARF